MFVTLFYGILNTRTGALRYTCAGHNPPLHYQAASGSFVPLSTSGMALGVLAEVNLGQATTLLQPGDLLVCYTDGVTEAINGEEEPFEVERLEQAIVDNREASAARVIDAVLEALGEFCGDRPAFDDVTLVAIRRVAGPHSP